VKLLVSPKDEQEALEAVAGGADIIDVKNPAEGSLGANFPWIIKRIRKLVPRNIEVSATIGDMPNLPGTASLAALGAAVSGVNYVKVGLLGPRTFDDAVSLMRSVVRTVKEFKTKIKVVVAAYADWERAGTIDPLLVPDIAWKSGSQVAMIDTKVKDGKRLFDFLSLDNLSIFVERSHGMGILSALAGSLKKDDIPVLAKLNVDVIGVRRAAVEGIDRVSGQISRRKVRELADVIKKTTPEPSKVRKSTKAKILVMKKR
jgi:uncharacterized protein (UPF0264 family)